MPNIKYTEIITKILLRNDILENWEVSSLILERGEPAVVLDAENKTAKIKIGDGVSTFSELPYSTVTPDDVEELVRESLTNIGQIHSVELTSGTENGTLKLTINGTDYDNIAVTGLGTAAYTDSSAYATAEQGKKADAAMIALGLIDELPTENVAIGYTYTANSYFVIPGDKCEFGTEIEVFPGNTICLNKNGEWTVVSRVANALSRGISATLTGAVSGAAVKEVNAGETLAVEVTEVNTDYLIQGSKIVLLNGGNAFE